MLRKAIFLTLLCLLGACDETILHELTEQQANKAFIILSRAGIESTKATDGVHWTLQVAKQDASMALSELEAARVFVPEKDADAGSGFGLIQSAEQRAHAIAESQSRKVADTLKRIPGVLDARVHLFRDKRDVLEAPSEAMQGSASVLLIVDTGISPEIEAVKSLVAGALGLIPATVSVIVSESKVPATVTPTVHVPIPEQSPATINAESVEVSQSANAAQNPRTLYLGIMALSLTFGLLMFRRTRRKQDAEIQHEVSTTQPLSVLSTHEVF